jgi:hypothetical protein
VLLPQVLPVNDTCVYNMWWDSYPYSSVSVHALHPQYLALRATLEDLPGVQMPPNIAAAIEAARVGRQDVWRDVVVGLGVGSSCSAAALQTYHAVLVQLPVQGSRLDACGVVWLLA